MKQFIENLRLRFMTEEQWEKRREQRHKELDEAIERSKQEYAEFLKEVDHGIRKGHWHVRQAEDQGDGGTPRI